MTSKLEELDALFSDESKWTKRTSARNKFGTPISTYLPYASSFSLYGAMFKQKLDAGSAEVHCVAMVVRGLFYTRIEKLGHYGDIIVQFNDHPDTTFADIKAVIAKAIEMEKTE